MGNGKCETGDHVKKGAGEMVDTMISAVFSEV